MGSFGTSISTTLWDHRATLHHAQLAEHLTAYDPAMTQALAGLQASGMSPEQSLGAINRLVDTQAALKPRPRTRTKAAPARRTPLCDRRRAMTKPRTGQALDTMSREQFGQRFR